MNDKYDQTNHSLYLVEKRINLHMLSIETLAITTSLYNSHDCNYM